MPNRIQVSNEVKEVLDKVGKRNNIISYMERLGAVINVPHKNWIDENNLTEDILVDIYKNGYKLKHNFNIGDLVCDTSDGVFHIVSDVVPIPYRSWVRPCELDENFILACKAENLEIEYE